LFAAFERLIALVNALDSLVEKDKGTAPLLVRYLPIEDAEGSSYQEILGGLEEVEAELSRYELPELRRMFIEDIMAALKMQCREGMGEAFSFSDRVSTYVGVPGVPASDETIANLEGDLTALLEEKGFRGASPEMLKQWQDSVAVPKEEFPRYTQGLIDRALTETSDKVWLLPAGTSVEFEPVTDVFYGGYSRALSPFKTHVSLNADLDWTAPTLKNTVAHESFPGHSALNGIRAQDALRGYLPPEASFYLANTPITPIIEGTCNLGTRLLGWHEGIDDEIGWTLTQLRSARNSRLVFALHQDGYSNEEVIAELMSDGVTSRVAAETRLRFLSDPLWCTSLPHYWYGTLAAIRAFDKFAAEGRIDELKTILFREIHTFRTFLRRTGVTVSGTDSS